MAMTGGSAHLVKQSNRASLYVYVVTRAQSTAKNQTTLALGMYVTPTGSIDWGDWGGSLLGLDAYQGGSRQTRSFMTDATCSGTLWLVENVEVTVNHSDTGAANAVPILWAWGVNSTWGSFVKPSGTLYIDLPAIPRASTPTVSRSLCPLGQSMTVSTNRKSARFTHTLTYAFGAVTGTIATGVGDSVVWTPPLSLAAQLSTSQRGDCVITCVTWQGGARIGSAQCTVTLDVGAAGSITAQPGWFTLSPGSDNSVAQSWGVYLAGLSYVKAAFDAGKISPGQGAALKPFQLRCQGRLYASPWKTQVLRAAGSVSCTAIARDSRDLSLQETKTIQVLPYEAPSLTGVTCCRCDSGGVPGNEGAYLWAKATARFSSVEGRNACTLRLKLYAKSTGQLLRTETLQSGTGKVCGGGLVSAYASYTAVLEATDTLGSTGSVSVTIPTAQIAFHIKSGGGGAAFGGAAETDNCLDVKWDNLKLGGETLADFPVAQGTSGVWTYRKWRSGLAELWGAASGTVTTANPWGNVYTSNQSIVLSYPFPLPTVTAVLAAPVYDGAANYWLCTRDAGGTSTQTPGYQIVRAASDSVNYKVFFYVTGRWK